MLTEPRNKPYIPSAVTRRHRYNALAALKVDIHKCVDTTDKNIRNYDEITVKSSNFAFKS